MKLINEMRLKPDADPNDLRSIFRYAITVDGYAYSKEHFGKECGFIANKLLIEYSRTGTWKGSFEELRCCLFFEQRRAHHVGELPTGESLTVIFALYRKIVELWELKDKSNTNSSSPA